MHTLEHMLFLLSQRIQNETGDAELSEVTLQFASELHHYERTSDEPDWLREMHEDWCRRFTVAIPDTEPEDL
jgi:hypothetical protein